MSRTVLLGLNGPVTGTVAGAGTAARSFHVEHPDRPVSCWAYAVSEGPVSGPLTDGEVQLAVVTDYGPVLLSDYVTERGIILKVNGNSCSITTPGEYIWLKPDTSTDAVVVEGWFP